MSDREFLAHYDRYKDKIHAFFLYRVNFDRSVAEDLTQDVFLKAYRHFDTFDPTRPFQAWIYRIARNHLQNWYRDRKVDLPLEAATDASDRGVERLAGGLELERVLRAIETLDPYHRDVLLLKHIDCLTTTEIAALLDKDEGAVRTQLSRAKEALKKICEQT